MSEVKGPERIVFADSDEYTRLLVRKVYEPIEDLNENAVMVTCTSGEELLLRIRIIEPDLLIIGQNLAGIDGLETIRRLRDIPEGAGLPVIYLSDKSNLAMLDKYYSIGIAGILYKPIDTDSLPETIAQIWRSVPERHKQYQSMFSAGQETQPM